MRTEYKKPIITVDILEKEDVLLASKTIEENAYQDAKDLFSFTPNGWSIEDYL